MRHSKTGVHAIRTPAALAVGIGLAYAGVSRLVTVVTSFGGSSGTTFWPGAGLTLGALLWRPRREWPLILSAVFAAEFSLNLFVSHLAADLSAGWALANTVEPLIGAMLLRRILPGTIDLSRTKDLFSFVAFGVIVAPMIGAAVGVGTGRLTGFYGLLPAYPRWFVGDAMGVLVIAPAILVLTQHRDGSRESVRRALAAAGVLGAATILTLGPWDRPWGMAPVFLVVPMLAVISLRTGLAGAAFGIGVVALLINGLTAADLSPFSIEDEIAGLIQAQAFLAMAAFTALLTAALAADLLAHERSERAKDDSIRVVSHDVRGPLGVIRGFVEMLREHGDRLSEADKRHALGRIDSVAARLQRLVTDVLDIDRVSPEAELPPVRLDRVIEEFVPALEVDGHPLAVECEPIVAALEPTNVERIVENLVQNAVRHTPPGTPIDVNVGRNDGGVLIEVNDRGPGVPDTEKEAIFEPFRRGQSTRVGTGLGLALVASFAERHHGRAWVEDRAGGGASFRVYLRTRPAEQASTI